MLTSNKRRGSAMLSKGLMTELRGMMDKHRRGIPEETKMLIREGIKAEIEWARTHVALKKQEADLGAADEPHMLD